MMNKESKYINVKGQLMDLSEPRVMGILNVTPDSFYSESRLQTVEKIAARVVEIVNAVSYTHLTLPTSDLV